MRPLHELVQAAQFAHQLIAGTQVQVVGVGQYQRSAESLQLRRGKRLDGSLGAHRREDRRFQVAVGRVEKARASTALGGEEIVFKHGGDYIPGGIG